jgi:hypothetical protein
VPQQLIRTALELELQEGTVTADRLAETPCVFLAGLYRAERTIPDRLTACKRHPALALNRFDGRSITHGIGELDMLVPAYAATIHKSQGYECPAVVIPVFTQHYPMRG